MSTAKANSLVSIVMNWAAAAEVFVPECAFLCYSRGVFQRSPDFILPVSKGDFSGLLVFVSETEVPNADQKFWSKSASELKSGDMSGYCCIRVWGGPASAIEAIRDYLEVPAGKAH